MHCKLMEQATGHPAARTVLHLAPPQLRRPAAKADSTSNHSAVVVHMLETEIGTWAVRDGGDRQGGIFRSREAALGFVRDAFGPDAQIQTVRHASAGRSPPSTPVQKTRSKMPKAKPKAIPNGGDIFARCESQVQSYARAFPRTFERALGTTIWDRAGRRYLDFLAGAGSLNYGHNNPVLKQALLAYIAEDGITHSLDLHTVAKERFLEAFHDIVLAPRALDYVVQFTGPTGTNAVEAALKLARKATGRSGIVCFTNAFHGVSLGSLATTGNAHFRRAAGVPLGGATALPYDGYFGPGVDTLDYLECMLDDPASGLDQPAAVIVETIQGEGGLKAARANWLKRLQALCHKHGIVFIVDDIQAGCGRSNSFFSFEEAGLEPDVVTLSKSLSGFGLPMAVVLIKRSLDVWKPAEHNGTFRGNNHAFVTAAAALHHYWRTPEFATELTRKSEHLAQRLAAFVTRHPGHIAEVRGRGMMRGLRCRDPEQAAQVTAKAFRKGLIIERAGPFDEVIKFLMPLTTERAEIDEGLDILGEAMDRVFAHREEAGRVHAIRTVDRTNGMMAPAAAMATA